MLPIIDLEDFPSQSQILINACAAWGCFRIRNHGIPVTLLSEMKSVSLELLDLPVEIKRRNGGSYGVGYLESTGNNPLHEGFGLFDVASAHAVDEFCNQLHASPHQRETIEKYCKAIHELSMEVGKKIAESMGLRGDFLKGWASQMRINGYNFTPETLGSTGVRAHSDSGFLTILQEDEMVGGLEIMDKKTGEYLAVDHMPGSLFVNVGDMAKIWSNGKFHNIKHRVICKEAATRVSIVLFILGPKEGAVEAPPELVGPKNPRLYPPIALKDYRNLLQSGEALEQLRTSNVSKQIAE